MLLVLPLALLAGYLMVQRRRHTQVLRFTSVDLLDSVAPRRQGWQRHVPAAAMLLTLVVLTLAFAEPALAMRTPKDTATIMLTLDTSASMTATDVAPSRLAAAEAQASQFVEKLPRGIQVGLVGFDASARLLVPPTTDRAQLTAAIRSLDVGSGTATASGIRESLAAIEAVPKGSTGKPVPAAIVLMSDGSPTIGDGQQSPSDAADAAAQEAKEREVPVNTIAFGTSGGTVTIQGQDIAVPIDPESMAGIAQASGGRSFTAENADELGSIYTQIGRDVAYTVQTRDLTAAFAGVALLTAVLGRRRRPSMDPAAGLTTPTEPSADRSGSGWAPPPSGPGSRPRPPHARDRAPRWSAAGAVHLGCRSHDPCRQRPRVGRWQEQHPAAGHVDHHAAAPGRVPRGRDGDRLLVRPHVRPQPTTGGRRPASPRVRERWCTCGGAFRSAVGQGPTGISLERVPCPYEDT